MSKFVFLPPSGEPIESPSMALIEAVLLNADPIYWEKGSGDAGIHELHSENQLILQFVADHGFCVVHETSNNAIPMVLINENVPEGTARVRLSGNELSVPRSYFVPAKRAVEAASNFINSSSPRLSGNWVEYSPQL